MTRPRSSTLLVLTVPLAGLVTPGTPVGPSGPDPTSPAEPPLVTNAVIPQPLGTDRASLYLTVRSRDSSDDELLAIEAEGVAHVALHRTSREGGIPRMRPVEAVELPAGRQVQLEPGDLHAMLEHLERAWEAGETVALRLTFRGAGTVEARARVVPFSELEASLH